MYSTIYDIIKEARWRPANPVFFPTRSRYIKNKQLRKRRTK